MAWAAAAVRGRVDAGRVAAGATGRNEGFLLGGPDAYLHTAIAEWGEDAAVDLYRATLRELDHLAALVPDVVMRVGSIRLAGLPGDSETSDEAADHARELADCAEHEAALHIAGRFAGSPVEVTSRWAASVGFTVGASGRALCTAVDDGVVAIGGYYGTGNLVGPVAARAAAGLVLDGTPPPPCFAS